MIHAERVATRCGHLMHRSAPAKTIYCGACVLSSVVAAFDAAETKFKEHGGKGRPPELRNSSWRNSHLSYRIAARRMEKVRKLDERRMQRESKWDGAHSIADTQRSPDDSDDISTDTSCPVCTSADEIAENFQHPERNVTWWERPNTLVQFVERREAPVEAKAHSKPRKALRGSPSIRAIITAIRALRKSRKKERMRRRIKVAVRRKHSDATNISFSCEFFASPLSSSKSLQSHKERQSLKRLAERHKRGNPLPRLPPRT